MSSSVSVSVRWVRVLLRIALLLSLIAPLPALRARDAAEMRAAFAALPESNPYRAVLLRYAEISDEDQKALTAWARPDSVPSDQPAPAFGPEQRQLASELAAALRAAVSAPPALPKDWPLVPNPADPDNPAAITLAGVAPLRDLAIVANRAAADLPSAEAIDTYAAVAQLGRQQRAGLTLLEQLAGAAIEGLARADVARRLGEFSAEDLRRLSAAWRRLAPAPDNARSLAGERDVFFKPFVEKILLPGLRELLAAGATGDEPDPGESSKTSLVHDLRLSGLARLGENDHLIILENVRTGESFTLRSGAPAEGVELVSLDFDRRLAVIRRGAEEAVIELESKRIVSRKSAAAKLRELLTSFDAVSGPDSGRAALRHALARARAHPDGPEGYARELLAAYQAGIDHQLELARIATYPDKVETPADPNADPLLAMAMPMLGKVARTLTGSATQTAMLNAAIHLRLTQLGEAPPGEPPPDDPWAPTDVPFTRESTPDGGFILRSAYETRAGQPVTYKFAAPDAGFVRVSPKP